MNKSDKIHTNCRSTIPRLTVKMGMEDYVKKIQEKKKADLEMRRA